MKKTLTATAILLGLLATYLATAESLHHLALKHQGKELIRKIEHFRAVNGHLPSGLPEMGLPNREEGPIYYTRADENRYRVWYGMRLGESGYYDSATGVWAVGG